MGSIEDLPQRRGLPVPWVVRWTGEKPHTNVQTLPPNPGEVFCEVRIVGVIQRDKDGVAWQPDGTLRRGSPEWGQMNTHRQVACMRYNRCQVCGSKIEEETIKFVLGHVETRILDLHKDKVITTSTPPVCTPCSVIAREKCPHLLQGNRVFEATKVTPIAVWGTVFMLTSDGRMAQHNTEVALGHPAIKATVGKQMVVAVEGSWAS